MSVDVPYQCIRICGSVLCAARGGFIHTFSLQDGSHRSTWRHPDVSSQSDQVGQGPSRLVSTTETDTTIPPAKRRKVEAEDREDREEPLTSKAPSENDRRIRPSYQLSDWPMVTLMAATKDGGHLVAVTGHDKTLWVFSHDGNGALEQLSQRTMPKRPCSIVVSPLGDLIFSGDKFGDVYSVPLIETNTNITRTLSAAAVTSPAEQTMPSKTPTKRSRTTKPAASELTVHTQRNMRALAHQQKHKTQEASDEPVPPSFEHSLLLGHVSILTQVILGYDSDERMYLLSADRDEHIRVSRGPPHAYIIEGFCQGHTGFVSRLSIPPTHPNLLVSGGGDDDLFLWDWKKRELLSKTKLLQHVREVDPDVDKLAVTGIACIPLHYPDSHGAVTAVTTIAVSCERIPALFFFNVLPESLEYKGPLLTTGGDILDFQFFPFAGDQMSVVISLDLTAPHAATSTDDRKNLQVFRYTAQGEWRPDATGFMFQDSNLNGATAADLSPDELHQLLYTTENLRKKKNSGD